MKQRVTTLIITVCVLGLLIGAYFLVNNLSDGSDEETTAPPVLTYSVADIDRTTLYSLGYTYDGEQYDLTLKEDMTGWTLKTNESLPISNVKIAEMVTAFTGMTSTFRIEDPSAEKLTEYGFDEPTAEIYFYDGDGRHSYTVGMFNTFNSMYYVMSSDDENNVFLVNGSFMEAFELSEADLLQIEEVPTASLSNDIKITFTVGDEKLVYTFYPSGKKGYLSESAKWFLSINDKDEFPINEELATALSDACAYLGYAECVSYSEEDIPKYGLDNAVKIALEYTHIEVSTDSETGEEISTETKESYEFMLGGVDEEGYSYAKSDSSPLIYVTVSNVYEELYSFDRENISSICTGYIFNVNDEDITEMKLTLNGKTHTLTVTESASGMNYTIDGKEISKESASALISSLSVLEWETDRSAESGTTAENSLLTVELTSESMSISASFSAYSDKFYACSLDFTDDLLISKETVDDIITAVSELIK